MTLSLVRKPRQVGKIACQNDLAWTIYCSVYLEPIVRTALHPLSELFLEYVRLFNELNARSLERMGLAVTLYRESSGLR